MLEERKTVCLESHSFLFSKGIERSNATYAVTYYGTVNKELERMISNLYGRVFYRRCSPVRSYQCFYEDEKPEYEKLYVKDCN